MHLHVLSALLTITKIWKQPKYPLTGKWIKKMWLKKKDMVHIYNGILLSHKKNEIIPFAATWMGLEFIILGDINQREKDKYNMISFTYRI